jgi:hypothetical protein
VIEPVADLVLAHWDVIGITEIDTAPEREYAHDAEKVLVLLDNGARADDVEALLRDIGAELGVPIDHGRDRGADMAVDAWYRRATR